MNRILAGAIGLAVVSAVFQSLERDRLDSELEKRSVTFDERQREQREGLLAGSEAAREAVPNDPKGIAEQIERVAAEAFTFALGNATWVLVGVLGVCTILTWWLVEPKQPTTEVPGAAQADEHRHHRFGGFHL